MLQVEALVATTEAIANETIEGSSAADYDVEKHSIMKEVMMTTLGLATLKKTKASNKMTME